MFVIKNANSIVEESQNAERAFLSNQREEQPRNHAQNRGKERKFRNTSNQIVDRILPKEGKKIIVVRTENQGRKALIQIKTTQDKIEQQTKIYLLNSYHKHLMKNCYGQIPLVFDSIEEEQHQNANLKLRKSSSFKQYVSTFATICSIPKFENKKKLRRSITARIFSHYTLLDQTSSKDEQLKCGQVEASISIRQNGVFNQETKLISQRNGGIKRITENFGHSRLSKLREKYVKIRGGVSYTFDWHDNRILASQNHFEDLQIEKKELDPIERIGNPMLI